MRTQNSARRFMAIFWAITLLLQSCSSYQRYMMKPTRLKKINDTGVTYFILDSSRPSTHCWLVRSHQVKGQDFICDVERMSEAEAEDVYTIQNGVDAKESRNEILIFAEASFAAGIKDKDQLTLPFSSIEKAEVCEKSPEQAVGSALLIAGCVLLGVSLIGVVLDGY